jgi:NAD(P)H-dependent flavin oxidoreductase YrpB (nitropropane dioxygenase family)
MLKTPLCDVLGIDVPIILAAMGSASSGEFAASVSNEGELRGEGIDQSKLRREPHTTDATVTHSATPLPRGRPSDFYCRSPS